MATLQCLMKFMVYYSLVNLLCFSYDPIEASEIQYRMMKVNKDSQTSECVPSTRTAAGTAAGTAGPMMFEVAHRYGHCSSNPSSAEIQLSNDQLRVDHIRARLESYTKFDDESNNATSSLPARSGVPLGGGNYVVRFGRLGTLMFDTGSELTWTNNARNPSSSDIIKCYYRECFEFRIRRAGEGETPECEEDPLSECDFNISYVDGTTIEGILTKVNLTITTTTNSTHDHVHDVFTDFIMGYLDHLQQPFGNNINGILGLSRGDFSFVSQTAEKYGEYFRYCLPSNQNSTGYLAFGNESSSSDHIANFTPFTRQYDMHFYYVEITSIFVGGTELAMIIDDSVVFEAIIDSGTVITRLPTDIYTAMRDKFNEIMTTGGGINMNYTKAPAFSILDTCYDTSNVANISVPAVSFTFNGNVTVEFDPSGIIYAINSSLACFAFAGTNGDIIFGNTQQRTYEVVYDVANNKLGFRPNACN